MVLITSISTARLKPNLGVGLPTLLTLHSRYQTMVGAEAKRRGKSFERVEFDGNFEEAICKAIRSKLLSNKAMLSSLIDSNLPLTHYYVYGYSDDNCKVINAGYEWITEYIDSVRKSCQQREWKP